MGERDIFVIRDKRQFELAKRESNWQKVDEYQAWNVTCQSKKANLYVISWISISVLSEAAWKPPFTPFRYTQRKALAKWSNIVDKKFEIYFKAMFHRSFTLQDIAWVWKAEFAGQRYWILSKNLFPLSSHKIFEKQSFWACSWGEANLIQLWIFIFAFIPP